VVVRRLGVVAGVAICLALTAAVLPTASVLGAGPTGSAPAIALFESVASTMNAQPAVRIHQTGYMELSATTRPERIAFRFGYGSTLKGYVRASESITYAQHRGVVVWVRDVVVPVATSCASGASCPVVSPIELFVTRHAAFAGVIDEPGAQVGCYEREPPDAVPYRAGAPWWTAAGDFHALVVRGNEGLLTVTYAWPDSQHATERDAVNLAKQRFVRSTIRVAKGPSGTEPAFTIVETDTVLAAAPHAPKVARCS
jgi:hypothetical protein